MAISNVPATVGVDPFTATFTASETVESFAVDDLALVNATASGFDASNAPVFTAVITPDGNGDVSVSVPAGAFNDIQGNLNIASSVATATLDLDAPTVAISNVPTTVGVDPFTATFTASETVESFAVDDLALVNATASGFDASNAPVFTAVITPDGNGDVSVSVPAGAFNDIQGNLNIASSVATATLDLDAPTVAISNVPTTVGVDPFTATFTASETVESFAVDDLALVNATASGFDASNAPVFTAVITPDGNGDVSVSVPAGAFNDIQGNLNIASSVATATLDLDAPTVAISNVPTTVGVDPFTATFTASETVESFAVDDLALVNAAASGFDASNAPVFTAVITPDGNGDVSVSVPAGAFNDIQGNLNIASSVATATLDLDAPTVTISNIPATVGVDPFTATFTASETVESFAVDDLALVNAAASGFDASNAPVFTAVITPDGNGDVSVSVPAGAFNDIQGNPNIASSVAIATLDSAPPSVSSIVANDSDPSDGSLSWVITFSEDVSGVGPGNFEVEGVA